LKVSALIAKLQQFHPDSDLTEIDVLRLFDDDSAVRDAQAKAEAVKAFLEAGDMDGLRRFIEAEEKTGPGE
jgi:hypothetical protein